MADNVTLNAGSGGVDLATDEITSVHHQYVKIEYGADGAATPVSDSNPLPIDDAGGSLTVDGTVTANQGGTWNINNLSGTVSLPTGAATAANQSTIIGHVDGIEALLTTIDADTSDIHTNSDTIAGAVSGSEMQVDIVADGAGLLTTSAFNTVLGSSSLILATQADDVANTADGLQTTSFGYAFDGTTWDRMRGDSTNGLLVNLGSNNDVTVTGTVDLGATDNAVLDSIDTATTSIAGAVSGSEVQVDVVAALPAGTNAIGKLAANSGVDIGDVDVLSSALPTGAATAANQPSAATPYRNVDVDETEDEVKGSAGTLLWGHAMNLTDSVLYLQFYDATAASVTVGTTTPDLTFPLPTAGNATDGAGTIVPFGPAGTTFSTAITIACTTTYDGASGPAANGCFVNLGYA